VSRREQQAQQTRDEILAAARRLFAERGYARTSVRDIAAAAAVSAQTVYDSIGSKQALVARLNDLIDVEAGVSDLAGAAFAAGDRDALTAVGARITRTIVERCGDILTALVTGAASEPALDEVLAEGHRRHVAGAAATAARLGVDGVDPEAIAAATDFRLAMLLRDTYGWDLDRIEAWMTAAVRAVVASAPPTA
jgi:AcrR family transcriptional regulator